jgi:hypothetical protein
VTACFLLCENSQKLQFPTSAESLWCALRFGAQPSLQILHTNAQLRLSAPSQRPLPPDPLPRRARAPCADLAALNPCGRTLIGRPNFDSRISHHAASRCLPLPIPHNKPLGRRALPQLCITWLNLLRRLFHNHTTDPFAPPLANPLGNAPLFGSPALYITFLKTLLALHTCHHLAQTLFTPRRHGSRGPLALFTNTPFHPKALFDPQTSEGSSRNEPPHPRSTAKYHDPPALLEPERVEHTRARGLQSVFHTGVSREPSWECASTLESSQIGGCILS